MQTECSADLFGFTSVEGRKVVTAFDGGQMTSDAGAIAKWFVPGPHGFIVTTLLGIVGAIVATWLGQHIGWYRPGQGAGFVGGIVGAVIILAVYRAFFGGPT